MECIKQRTDIEYNLKELTIILKESHILSEQIEVKSLKGINKIFDNQGQCGEEVKNIFNNKAIINCLVFGMTQTGKTGCMTSLIQYYILSYNIPIDNIYIISGLSDKEWKKDTKNRMPDSINKRVLHRANLTKTFFKDIRDKKNCLIIMDEIQIACEDTQTIKKTFEKCGFYDLEFLLKNDIKLVQFTATPDGHINDISDWKQHYAKIKLSPGIGYYGPKQAIEQGRVKQFKDLTICENVLELKTDIEKYIIPRYHLIRVPNKRENKNRSNNQNIVISNFRKIFGDNCEYNIDFLKVKKGDINDILKNEPIRHTFVFYCEILRCAKTQCKKYIGISYERFSNNINDSTIIQGSFGRLTGYDDNSVSICYTNLPSLENYIKLWNNDMEFKEGIEWNTKTTNYDTVDNIAYSTGTFNSVKHIEQLKDGCSEKIKEVFDVDYEVFDDWNKLKERCSELKYTHVRKPSKKDENGFYKTSLNKKSETISLENAISAKNRSYGYNKNKQKVWRTYIPCYRDLNNINSLVYLLIVRPE
tara:strand:+ start:173 stop:1765 length:1593 start_codon:yes stop_codon:yes gene_type:complete